MIQTNSNHFSFKAAIYCRLSKDDEQKGESASIQNQKELLENYVKSRGWSIYDVYIDDGYTGLNTNRPSFQRLIRDIENKKVDIVITKDLSRLGRNYLQTGYYTENFFPKNNVRYIALNDGVDTFQENNEIVPFKNVLNEFYSRDVSKKMKSAYMTRARQGKFIGCLAPIGYRKDNDDPHKLVIDDETSWIVEKIFDLAFSGYGVQAIRRRLFEEKIPTPTWWNRKKGLRNKKTKLEMTVDGGEYWWDCTTLKEIIENPVYIGHIASQKVNYKFKVGWLSDKPKEEWIIVENTHEPIISEDIYNIANEKLKSRRRPFKNGEESIFAGIVKCPDCGKSLNLGRNKSKKREKLLTCNTYRRYGKSLCSQHRIYYDTLYEIVLKDIRKNAEIALKDEKEIIKALEKSREIDNEEEQKFIMDKIYEDQIRVEDLTKKIERLYDDWLDNKISESNFQKILEKSQNEQDYLNQRIEDNQKLIVKEDLEDINVKKWIELINMVMQKNNMHDTDTFEFFKYIIKMFIAVYLASHAFEFSMAVFDVAQNLVNKAAGVITTSATVSGDQIVAMVDTLKEKEIGELLMILVETSLVRIAIQCISLTITLIVYGRMFEIYVYSSVSSIPFATMGNKEWGQIGTNYIKGLFALGLQGLFLMICLGIYTVLIRTVQITDIHASLFSILGYALLLGLMMFKSGTVAKSIMNTH